MYRWCAYCQTFMGESEPRADFSLTHGICGSCKSTKKSKDSEAIDKLRPLIDLFDGIRKSISSHPPFNTTAAINQAIQLGIKPSDLLIGMMQPILWDIGEKVSLGEVTIIQEHEFSRVTNDLVGELCKSYGLKTEALIDPQRQSDVYLVCCDGNYHYLGLRFLELLIRQEGISVQSIFPSLPFQEILQIDRKIKPKVIGISVMLHEQFLALKSALEQLSPSERFNSLIIIGGQGVAAGSVINRPNVVIYDGKINGLTDLIRARLTAEAKSA